MKIETKTIHGGQSADKAYGAVMPPIYQTSTYAQSVPGEHQGYEYSRSHNPTRTALEQSITSLESAKHGLAFASGMAAIDSVLRLLSSGDHLIIGNDLYGGSFRIVEHIISRFGITYDVVDMTNLGNLQQAMQTNTKLVWLETPTNPMMRIADIAAIAKILQKRQILFAVDNTFATPYLQQPLTLGANIVVHSATKYLAGHSDTILGLIATNDNAIADRLRFIQNACGAVCGPFDSFLTLRGIKTLALRMQRQCENAEVIATFLQNHPLVAKTHWPGFTDHAGHQIAKKQMQYFGAIVSIEPKFHTKEQTNQFLKSLKTFTLAESLGGVESLVGQPALMTHAAMKPELRRASGIVDHLIRFSVGIEHVDDLIADIEQAFNQL